MGQSVEWQVAGDKCQVELGARGFSPLRCDLPWDGDAASFGDGNITNTHFWP